ncbi:hypothetical protein P3T76_013037 [Phytophthora citrophthora]|uniref:Uncharacterized protein n=1 Tax=Phytophthora citrophthora TaxID=4793 RepID=A0AAD9LCC6_9STRA|nr:hypothetical protein P3T76_013037 [Phytophthora citrophthora]
MDDDAAFLADVTAILSENHEQLDVSSLPAAVDDVILDSCCASEAEIEAILPNGHKGRREARNTKAAERRRKYRVKMAH